MGSMEIVVVVLTTLLPSVTVILYARELAQLSVLSFPRSTYILWAA